jgi:hypothetical protein
LVDRWTEEEIDARKEAEMLRAYCQDPQLVLRTMEYVISLLEAPGGRARVAAASQGAEDTDVRIEPRYSAKPFSPEENRALERLIAEGKTPSEIGATLRQRGSTRSLASVQAGLRRLAALAPPQRESRHEHPHPRGKLELAGAIDDLIAQIEQERRNRPSTATTYEQWINKQREADKPT